MPMKRKFLLHYVQELKTVIQAFYTFVSGLLSTVAFSPRACTHGKVYILLTFTNEVTNRIKG